MIHEEERLYRQRHERVARVKRVLRWMPRKTTLHRYPVLKWFRAAAISRAYIWSFRTNAVVPALYAGSIIAFLPLYGIQIPLAVLAAFMLKANLPVLTSLQFITNPLTVLPIYYTAYQIGRLSLNLIQVETPIINMAEMRRLLQLAEDTSLLTNLQYVAKVWLTTCLGGAILGTFLAAVAATLYKMGAAEVNISYQRLRHLQEKRHQRHQQEADGAHPDSTKSPSKKP